MKTTRKRDGVRLSTPGFRGNDLYPAKPRDFSPLLRGLADACLHHETGHRQIAPGKAKVVPDDPQMGVICSAGG